MKKALFAAAMICLTMASCSDDDNDSNSNVVAVSGTWNLTAVTSAQPLDANGDGQSSTNFKAETGCFNNSNIIFGANNTAELNLEVPFFTSCIETTSDATYVQTGNSVVFTTVDEEGTVESETATRNGNTLSVETDFEVEIEVNGSTQTTTFPITLVFTRQ